MRLIKLSSKDETTADFTGYFNNLLVKKNSKVALKNLMIIPKDGIVIDDTNNNCRVYYNDNDSTYTTVTLTNGEYANRDELLIEVNRAFNQSMELSGVNSENELPNDAGCNGLEFNISSTDTEKTKLSWVRVNPSIWDKITLENVVTQPDGSFKKIAAVGNQNVFDSAILSNNFFITSSGFFTCKVTSKIGDGTKSWIVGLSQKNTKQVLYDTPYYDYWISCQNGTISIRTNSATFDFVDILNDDEEGTVFIYQSNGKIRYGYLREEALVETFYYNNSMANNIPFNKYFINVSIGNSDVVIKEGAIMYSGFTQYNMEKSIIENVEGQNVVLDSNNYENLTTALSDYKPNTNSRTTFKFLSNLNKILGFSDSLLRPNTSSGFVISKNKMIQDYILPSQGLTVICDSLFLNSFSSLRGNRQNILSFIPNYELVNYQNQHYIMYEDNELHWLDMDNNFDYDLSQLKIRILNGDEESKPLDILTGGVQLTLLIKSEDEK